VLGVSGSVSPSSGSSEGSSEGSGSSSGGVNNSNSPFDNAFKSVIPGGKSIFILSSASVIKLNVIFPVSDTVISVKYLNFSIGIVPS
jgi:hypothetical protein